MRLFRYMALHCGHLLVAVIGTAIITTSFGKLFHPRSVAGVIAREWAMSIVCAAVIGLLMYRTWRWRPAIWVWIIPAVWFAFGTLMIWPSAHRQSVLGPGGGLWYEISGSACVNGIRDMGCRTFFAFTIPFVRAMAYSIGALAGFRLFAGCNELGAKSEPVAADAAHDHS